MQIRAWIHIDRERQIEYPKRKKQIFRIKLWQNDEKSIKNKIVDIGSNTIDNSIKGGNRSSINKKKIRERFKKGHQSHKLKVRRN